MIKKQIGFVLGIALLNNWDVCGANHKTATGSPHITMNSVQSHSTTPSHAPAVRTAKS